MGYTTTFEGQIDISPPLDAELEQEVNDFCNALHDEDGDMAVPSHYCDFVVTSDGAKLEWNGSEKSYCMESWLTILIDLFFAPKAHVLNGHLDASGEQAGDLWRLEVKNNVVRRLVAQFIYVEE